MRRSSRSALLFSIALAGCAAESTIASQEPQAKGKGDDAPAGANPGPICSGDNCNAPGPAAPSPEGETACTPRAQFIYVVSNTLISQTWDSRSYGPPVTLWSYWPPTGEFTKVGDPPCLAQDGVANMTVDRNGFAWILGNSQKLYKVSTTDGSCASSIDLKSAGSFASIAFVGTTDKTLYALTAGTNINGSAPELRKIDTSTGTSQVVGSPSLGGAESWGTMTADADGNFFFYDRRYYPKKMFEIESATAKVVDSWQTSTGSYELGNAGLAFFGSQLYAFADTSVYRLDPSSKATEYVGTTPNNAVHIAGAGQSTCVPGKPVESGTKPPKVN